MQKILSTLIFLFLTLGLSAVGIDFRYNSIYAASKAAKAENKMIFLDAFTTWCGPCRMMDQEVFSDAGVGAFMNEHFVSVKMDMETRQGRSIANVYGVNAYPTLLFMDAEGEIVERTTGARPAKAFLELAQNAISGDNEFQLEKRYKAGEDGLDFIFQFVTSLIRTNQEKRTEKIIRSALDKYADQWDDTYAIGLMMYLKDDPTTPLGKYIIDHSDRVMEATGSSVYMANLQFRFLQLTDLNLKKKKPKWPSVADMKSLYKMHAPHLAERFVSHYEMLAAMRNNSIEELSNPNRTYLDIYGSDAMFDYFNFGSFLLGVSDQTDVLNRAKKHILKAISMNPKYMDSYLALSAIYKKLGDEAAADKARAKGVQIANNQGRNIGGVN